MATHDEAAELRGYRNELHGLPDSDAHAERRAAIQEQIDRIEASVRDQAGRLRRAAADARSAGLDGQAQQMDEEAARLEDALPADRSASTTGEQETAVPGENEKAVPAKARRQSK